MGVNPKSTPTTDCTHTSKGVSSSGIRKALHKGDLKPYCSAKPCKTNTSFEEGQLQNNLTSNWFCLQCGNVGCGDDNAQGGDAHAHFTLPRSDCHSLCIILSETSKCWCFLCNSEVDCKNPYLKDTLNLVKKVKSRIKFSTPVKKAIVLPAPTPAIPLPPPQPPSNPPKHFEKQKSNNKNKVAMNPDWPLGLDNLGNTCFMNSTLQCLSRTKSLIPHLELYGSGNTLHIEVSPDNSKLEVLEIFKRNDEDDNPNLSFNWPSSPTATTFMTASKIYDCAPDKETKPSLSFSTDVEDEKTSSPSPSSEIDSLLDVAAGPSKVPKLESQINVEEELKKPLKLMLVIPKESMTGKLKQTFMSITRHPDTVHEPISCDYGYRTCSFRPSGVHTALGRHFRPGQQHDSHELLRSVIDMLKKDVIKSFRLAIMGHYGVPKDAGKNCDPKIVELLKQWDRKIYHHTYVDKLFGGALVTTYTCLQCNSSRRSHEEFLDLSLPIRLAKYNPKGVQATRNNYSLFDDDSTTVINRTVDECLRSLVEPEMLTGSNEVECETCHKINLEKIRQGASIEDVFPETVSKTSPAKSQKDNDWNTAKSTATKQEQVSKPNKKEKRMARRKTKAAAAKLNEDSIEGQPTLSIVEDHFKVDCNGAKSHNTSEDDTKSSKSGSLDDYVVIDSVCGGDTEMKMSASKRKYEEMEREADEDDEDGDDLTVLLHVGPRKDEPPCEDVCDGIQGPILSKGLSESLQNLNLNANLDMDIDNLEIDKGEEIFEDDDLDMPAVDGVVNTSDIEDNCVPPLDLGFAEEKETMCSAAVNRDEGYSEGENSSFGKDSASVSASSSRNSISENDNTSNEATEKDDSANKPKPIPTTKCPCNRQQMISKPPELLTIHLKRFQMSTRGHASKVSEQVDFPIILDLTSYCSDALEGNEKSTVFDEDNQVIYSLYGIVEHSGSLNWGHYVAYIRVIDDKEPLGCNNRLADKWFHVSDSHVSESSERSVLSREPYLLFYERIRGQEKRIRMAAPQKQSFGVDTSEDDSGWNDNGTTVTPGPDYSPIEDNTATVSSSSDYTANSGWADWDNKGYVHAMLSGTFGNFGTVGDFECSPEATEVTTITSATETDPYVDFLNTLPETFEPRLLNSPTENTIFTDASEYTPTPINLNTDENECQIPVISSAGDENVFLDKTLTDSSETTAHDAMN